MRNIEKGVLLAEIFDVDTSKYVPPFKAWIKETPQYKGFVKKYFSLKKKRTYKAKSFLAFFESVDLDSSETIKEVMIEYGKICYLDKITSEQAYINPLIIGNLENIEMTIGDITVQFDGKQITLKELSKLEGFSFERKEELIKEKIDSWVKEVEESIMEPVEKYKDYALYLPKVKLLSKSRLFELMYLILINIFMISIYFVKLPVFEKILLDKHSLVFSIYVLTLTFVIVYDLIYLITFIRRKIRYGYYIKARDGVLEKIYIEKDNCEMKLRQYVYAELATYGDMDMKVSKFARISKYYQYIGYIRKRIGMKRRMLVDKVNAAEKTGFIITLLSAVTLIILMVL